MLSLCLCVVRQGNWISCCFWDVGPDKRSCFPGGPDQGLLCAQPGGVPVLCSVLLVVPGRPRALQEPSVQKGQEVRRGHSRKVSECQGHADERTCFWAWWFCFGAVVLSGGFVFLQVVFETRLPVVGRHDCRCTCHVPRFHVNQNRAAVDEIQGKRTTMMAQLGGGDGGSRETGTCQTHASRTFNHCDVFFCFLFDDASKNWRKGVVPNPCLFIIRSVPLIWICQFEVCVVGAVVPSLRLKKSFSARGGCLCPCHCRGHPCRHLAY